MFIKDIVRWVRGDVWEDYNLFRVRDDVFDIVGFADKREIETPVAVDAGLPEIGSLVVFFRVKGGMQKVVFEEAELFIKRALNCLRLLPSVPRWRGRIRQLSLPGAFRFSGFAATDLFS